MSYAFNLETLYSKTDNGLEILKLYLSNCIHFDKALQNPEKNPFKYRDEDTASAYLVTPDKALKDKPATGYWRIKDHGGDFFHPIGLAMQNTGLEFYPCLVHLYKQFGLVEGKGFFAADVKFSSCASDDDRPVGWYNVVYKEPHHDLSIIGRFVTPELAEKYSFKSVDYYEKIFLKKDSQVKTSIICKSTDSYPIFAYAPSDKWCKLYEPLAIKDKNGRTTKHGYLGVKPLRHVHGLQSILDEIDTAQIDEYNKQIATAKKENSSTTIINNLEGLRNDLMIAKVIICTGGSDGLNVASLGYKAIWFNSESEQISYQEYNQIKPYVKQILNLPDVDVQGIKYAYEVAENFWQMKSIWLPKEKLGTTGKDFRDWMKFYSNSDYEAVKYQFANLINGALQMKFFERNEKTNALKIRPSYLHYFLKVKGFHLYYPEKDFTERNAEQEYMYIHVVNKVVKQVYPNEIRKFCERYLINKGQNTNVIDLIKNSVQFNDKNLLSLDEITLDFKNYSYESQTFFFKNLYATVSAAGIELKPYKDYSNHVWNKTILKNNILIEKPFFEHYKDSSGTDKVKILRTDCDFMNYLINGSRTSWRKELEEPFNDKQLAEKKAYHEANRFNLFGKALTKLEKNVQEQHFLNKCFGLGYMMHRQKIESFAKALYVTDDTEKDSEHDANGGSGKSLFFNGLDKLLPKKFKIDGKNKSITTDKHILHGLTKESDYIYIEDLDQYTSIDFFYNWITSSVVVNPKNLGQYELGFFDFGKIAINSNFGLNKITASTIRRLFFISFSDYYHTKTDHYKEERKVSDDFGYDLFSTKWNDEQWNIFFNFLMQCCQLYLSNTTNELKAPQGNIDTNNLKASMGDIFIEWCDSYFTPTETVTFEVSETNIHGDTITRTETEIIKGTLNENVQRAAMQDSYAKRAGNFKKSADNFKKSLKAWCKMKGYDFNPKDLLGPDGRIKKIVHDEKGKPQNLEHFFIRTPDAVVQNEPEVNTNTTVKGSDKADDLPF